MKKEIPALAVKEVNFDELEKTILQVFRREIYLPILRVLLEKIPVETFKVKNAKAFDLSMAILKGVVRFEKGRMRGRFSSTTSKELKSLGGKWDRYRKEFIIPRSNLPRSVVSAIIQSEFEFQKRMDSVDKILKKEFKLKTNKKIRDFFERTLFKVEKSVNKSLKGSISVAPKIKKSTAEDIAVDYTLNLEKYIEKFSIHEIVELREKIKRRVYAGKRYEGVVDEIRKSYGVSQRKAKFLARQETSLMIAAFEKSRYQQAGVNKYVWTCVAGTVNHPVRPSHKALHGKTFFFDDPPITTMPGEPMRKNNPGEDYNCRCYARVIVNFKDGISK